MAQLIVFLKERELSRHPIGIGTVRIGREPGNDVVIDNVGISRHHATVRYDGTNFQVTDEGSQNGSFVSGTRISTHSLKDGDVLQLGKFSLKFTEDGGTGPLPPPPENTLGSRRGRDPQTTMALGAEEVAKLLGQPGSYAGPETRREPPPNVNDEATTPAQTSPVIWVGLGLFLLVALVGVFVLSR